MANALIDSLTDQGFTQINLPGTPTQTQWWHQPLSWRERLPIVRGYQRTIVIVDVPLQNGERVERLFAAIARLACTNPVMLREQERLAESMPWYAVPFYILSMIVGLGLAYFAGMSIEMKNYQTCVVLFRRDRVGSGLTDDVTSCAMAGEQAIAWAALWDPRNASIVDPRRPRSAWGAFFADARTAINDMHRRLRRDVPVSTEVDGG